MRRIGITLTMLLVAAGLANARGLVIPVEKNIPPLAMLHHRVAVTMEDQVASTKVEQVFRNHTKRPLEATYVFPVPRGASVREFAMWVDGKKVKGELVEAAKAKQIYTDIVRRTEDPGLLEYIGSDLLKMQIFPIPAQGDQKIEVTYTSIAKKDHEIVEYTYPLKTDGKATSTLEDFSMKLSLKSQQPIINIYSPTHAIGVLRKNDREATVNFEKSQSLLDKDFQLYYTTSGKDVGLTALLHKPITTQDGHFMLLISPRAELSTSQQVPRDMVFVLDTSGSMRDDNKIDQAKKALKHCLDSLTEKDRFAVFNFATTVNRYGNGMTEVNKEQLGEAKKWVDKLEAAGGTAINDALLEALALQTTKDDGRTFTVVFFTDGKPTIGETNADKILTNVSRKNMHNTRVFTFGVGNDLNATLLDQIAEQTRAISTYVRPDEDMEVKTSSFLGKISHPVLANLKLAAGSNVSFLEVYPPQLPDLFHGGQLAVLGRYTGSGSTAIKLSGTVGKDPREYVYELDFAAKTDDKPFVEELWARRKVGYLLEQIRINGEKKELVDEVTILAKKHGIATPYTSYLVVPDAAMPVAGGGRAGAGGGWGMGGGAIDRFGVPGGLPGAAGRPGASGPASGAGAGLPSVNADGTINLRGGAVGKPNNVTDFAKDVQKKPGDVAAGRSKLEDEKYKVVVEQLNKAQREGKGDAADKEVNLYFRRAEDQKKAYEAAQSAWNKNELRRVQTDKLGVDLSVQMNSLKNQERLQWTAQRRVQSRNCVEIGGVWIDDSYDPKMKTVAIKAMSDAYFRILDKKPEMKDVFKLGNYLVWVTPNNTALVIDTNDGKEQLTDAEIDQLFAAAQK